MVVEAVQRSNAARALKEYDREKSKVYITTAPVFSHWIYHGVIFGIIRNGRGLMPPYNRIEENDRWDLINYLRALQAGGNVAVGAVGRGHGSTVVIP